MNSYDGRCSCGAVKYRMTDRPLVVHGCHCTWCQRESGTAFAVNALIESDRMEILKGGLARVEIPGGSGKGQILIKCPECLVTLWSHYAGMGEDMSFVRVGTLDEPSALPPDVHIYTSTKQPWLVLEGNTPVMAEYYRKKDIWRDDSLKRFEQFLEKFKTA